jgi:hypothetical protein
VKDRYIDDYGLDSLPHLREAQLNKADVFVTTNEGVLDDRVELEKAFQLRILSLTEFLEEKKG